MQTLARPRLPRSLASRFLLANLVVVALASIGVFRNDFAVRMLEANIDAGIEEITGDGMMGWCGRDDAHGIHTPDQQPMVCDPGNPQFALEHGAGPAIRICNGHEL